MFAKICTRVKLTDRLARNVKENANGNIASAVPKFSVGERVFAETRQPADTDQRRRSVGQLRARVARVGGYVATCTRTCYISIHDAMRAGSPDRRVVSLPVTCVAFLFGFLCFFSFSLSLCLSLSLSHSFGRTRGRMKSRAN